MVVGRIQSLTGYGPEATLSAFPCGAPHHGSLLQQNIQAKKMEVTVFCDLITKVTSHHFSCSLFLRSKTPGLVHTQGQEITQGGGCWGPSSAHQELNQVPKQFSSLPWPTYPVPRILEFNNVLSRDFPGGPVVKTSPSSAGGAGSLPGQGAKIPHASWPKNQNIKQKQ